MYCSFSWNPSFASCRGKRHHMTRNLTWLCWQKWNGNFFNKGSLRNLGLSYQFGHSGGVCPCPLAGPKDFVVFNITGPHFVTFKYCNCGEQPLSNWTQLLHERWFPTTLSRPKMAFTFDCLETFHELTLQGKTNLFDYYHTLLQRSNNTSIYNSIVSPKLSSYICRNNFNLSYMEGAGKTVGEDVETIWASTNLLVLSIREMGPAAQHETLNDQWNGWNFHKIIRLCMFSSFLLFNISLSLFVTRRSTSMVF